MYKRQSQGSDLSVVLDPSPYVGVYSSTLNFRPGDITWSGDDYWIARRIGTVAMPPDESRPDDFRKISRYDPLSWAREGDTSRLPKAKLPSDAVYDTDLNDLVKNASISGQVLTLTQSDDTTITITIPTTSGGGGLTAANIADVFKGVSISNRVLRFEQFDNTFLNLPLPTDVGLTQAQTDARIAGFARETPSGRAAKTVLPTDVVYDADLNDLIKNASISGQVLTLTQNDDTTITITIPTTSTSGGTGSLSASMIRIQGRYPAAHGTSLATSNPVDLSTARTVEFGTGFGLVDTAGNYFTLPIGLFAQDLVATILNESTTMSNFGVFMQRSTDSGATWTTLFYASAGQETREDFAFFMNADADTRYRYITSWNNGDGTTALSLSTRITRLTVA